MPTFREDLHLGHEVALWETDDIRDGAVTTEKLSDDAVTTDKIADGAVTHDKLAEGAVAAGDIAEGAVTNENLTEGCVVAGNLAEGAVENDNLTEECVLPGNIAPGAVESGNIAPEAVTNDKMAEGCVIAGNIAPGAVTTAKLTDGCVTTAKIEDYDPMKVPSGVTTAKIADGAVTTPKIADEAVTTIKIADRNVTKDKIADGAVSSDKLSPDLLLEMEQLTDTEPTANNVNPIRSSAVLVHGNALDVSVLNGSGTPLAPATYDSLALALAAVPSANRAGGMSIKFLLQLYTVTKSTSTELPLGTLLTADPGIDSGTYTADKLSAFNTLPTTATPVIYYISAGGEITTYTTWTVTKVQSSDNNYVQYRYMLPYGGNTTAENNKFVNVGNWQGVDDKPTAGSRNLVKSGGIHDTIAEEVTIGKKYVNLYSFYGGNYKNKYLINSQGYIQQSTAAPSTPYRVSYTTVPVNKGAILHADAVLSDTSAIVRIGISDVPITDENFETIQLTMLYSKNLTQNAPIDIIIPFTGYVAYYRRTTQIENLSFNVYNSSAIQDNSVLDVSELNNINYADFATAVAAVPETLQKGGMEIRYRQIIPATYTVAVTESDTEPTGTALGSASSVTDGTYIANQLSDFATLPSATGAGNAQVYYFEDSGTYTIWTITMATAESSKYMHYRLLSATWSTKPSNWQKADTGDLVSYGTDLITKDSLHDADTYSVSYSSADYRILISSSTGIASFGSSNSNKHIYLPVVAGEKYYVEGIPSYELRIAFATTNAATAGGKVPVVPGTSAVSVPSNNSVWITIPEGCTYLLLWRNDVATGFTVKKAVNTIEELVNGSKDLVESNAIFNSIFKNFVQFNDVDETELVDGYVYKGNGSSQSSEIMKRTSLKAIKEGCDIIVYGQTNSYSTALALYSEASTSSCIWTEKNYNVVYMPWTKIKELGATYFRCTIHNNQLENKTWFICFKNQNIRNTDYLSMLEGILVSTNAQVFTNSQKVTARNNIDASGELYSDININNLERFTKYIITDNGNWGTDSDVESVFIPIIPGKKYKAIPGSRVAILKSDSKTNNTPPDYSDSYPDKLYLTEDFVFTAPEDANYFYAILKNTSGVDSGFKFQEAVDPGTLIEELKTSYNLDYENNRWLKRTLARSIGNPLTPINIPVNSNNEEIPQTRQEQYAQWKALQMSQIQWTPKKSVPFNGGSFSPGNTVTGLPYSSTQEIDKYIGINVSIYTFMTAVNNPFSLLYTENIDADDSSSDWGKTYHGGGHTYFGTVCSSFTSYACGMASTWNTRSSEWLSDYGMKWAKIFPQSAQGVKIGDIYHRTVAYGTSSAAHHDRLISGIKRDANGNVTHVRVSESAGSKVRTNSYVDAATFNDTIIGEKAIIYRNIELYKNTYEPSPFVAVGDETITPYVYNNDICTFAGDKATFRENDLIVINYDLANLGTAWTAIEVYKDDVLLETYTLAEIDQSELPEDQRGHALNLGSEHTYGKYKARLTDGTNYSDYTYWEVIDTARVSMQKIFGGLYKIDYPSSNGKPVCLAITGINGSNRIHYDFEDEEIKNKYAYIDLIKLDEEQNLRQDISAGDVLKVTFNGDYGSVTNEPLTIDLT